VSSRDRLESYEKINYLLRPAKQVERKILIETLHGLAPAGLALREYAYLGFGSIYFADFILFHKLLYIKEMICVEKSPIPRRMKFNKPYRFVKLWMQRMADVIPRLNRKRRYLAWLDYDYGLNEEVLQDISGLLTVLAPGSILIVTVDAEPRLPKDQEDEELSGTERSDRVFDLFRHLLSRFFENGLKRNQVTRNALPRTLAQSLRLHIDTELARRREIGTKFLQLFNFQYADGAQMLTVGGIVGDEALERRVAASGVRNLPFVQHGDEPFRIAVPPLTLRERHWLERYLEDSTASENIAFELEPEVLDHFKRVARHYPHYHEILI